ncbi:MAG: Nif11-like leader peptide family natural product precursor [Synechococcus sp.]
MSREGLNDFLHAVDHSSTLRRDVRRCSNSRDLTELAQRYGFAITEHDLQLDEQNCRLQAWFDQSRINAIPVHRPDR